MRRRTRNRRRIGPSAARDLSARADGTCTGRSAQTRGCSHTRAYGADADAASSGGFLDNMRQALTGRGSGTSVPSVRGGASTGPDSRWNSGGVFSTTAPSPGGSFLGTAAASAAGVIGGALLLNSISSMFGHHGSRAFAAEPPPSGSPWDNNSAAGSDLARDAGLNDIGSASRGDARPASLFDDGASDSTDLEDDVDFGVDFGDDFGGSDSA